MAGVPESSPSQNAIRLDGDRRGREVVARASLIEIQLDPGREDDAGPGQGLFVGVGWVAILGFSSLRPASSRRFGRSSLWSFGSSWRFLRFFRFFPAIGCSFTRLRASMLVAVLMFSPRSRPEQGRWSGSPRWPSGPGGCRTRCSRGRSSGPGSRCRRSLRSSQGGGPAALRRGSVMPDGTCLAPRCAHDDGRQCGGAHCPCSKWRSGGVTRESREEVG